MYTHIWYIENQLTLKACHCFIKCSILSKDIDELMSSKQHKTYTALELHADCCSFRLFASGNEQTFFVVKGFPIDENIKHMLM